MNEDDFVTMVNPNSGDETLTHKDAFELVWEPKGWSLADSAKPKGKASNRSAAAGAKASAGDINQER